MDNYLALENWEYYLGNHRQFFNGQSLPKGHPLFERYDREVNRIFNSHNICGQIVDSYANALVGRPFNWSIVSDDGSICQPAEKIFAAWLEWQTEACIDLDLEDPLTNAVKEMLVADRGDGVGTGYFRVYSPRPYSSLEPFKQVIVHSPQIGQLNIERNLDGIVYKADYLYDNGERETYTLLENGSTLIESANSGMVADYRGRLPVFGMNGKCVLTDAVKRGQQAINRALSYKNQNFEATGFIERTVLNAQPPGQWCQNPQTGDLEFIREQKTLEVGNNVTSFISGIPLGDPQNPRGYTSPSLSVRHPVSPSTFVESIEMDISTIYHQVGLAYLTLSDTDSISSGSRQSLRDDFLCRLYPYQRTIECTLNRVLAIVIGALSESYPVLKGCRPVVRLNLAIAPSIDERQENAKDVAAGIMAIPTAIARHGLDVHSQLQLIRKYAHLVGK